MAFASPEAMEGGAGFDCGRGRAFGLEDRCPHFEAALAGGLRRGARVGAQSMVFASIWRRVRATFADPLAGGGGRAPNAYRQLPWRLGGGSDCA